MLKVMLKGLSPVFIPSLIWPWLGDHRAGKSLDDDINAAARNGGHESNKRATRGQ